VETDTTRKDGSWVEGRRLQRKAALVNTPPAYLSCAAVPGSLHQNNSSCIRLGERARDLDLPTRQEEFVHVCMYASLFFSELYANYSLLLDTVVGTSWF
jgi:hypothetical protein